MMNGEVLQSQVVPTELQTGDDPYLWLEEGCENQKYPRVFFMSSTRDDRVHPGPARKMFAKMKEQGHDVLYFDNIEGGHSGAADNRQAAYMAALGYTFLIKEP
jgi:prolyl oligopeptidase